MPAMSISVIGEPARSEITGIGAVSTSISGCSGSVTFCTSWTIGPRKSEMKRAEVEADVAGTRRSSGRPGWRCRCRDSSTRSPAARSPMLQSRKKSPTTFGKTLDAASATRSLFSLSARPRSTIASAAMPTSMPMLPRSAKPSLVSVGLTRFLTSTPKVAPRCVSPVVCRHRAAGRRGGRSGPRPGRVTSTLSSSSFASETSR